MIVFARIAAAVAHDVLNRTPIESQGSFWEQAYSCMTECASIPGCLPPGLERYFA